MQKLHTDDESWCVTTGSQNSKYEHRRTSALLRNIRNVRICMGKKTYRFCNLQKWKDFNKKQLTLLKMCVTSPLCGPRADLWPFYGFLCKPFSLYIKVYQGWALRRGGPTDPPKENGHKFTPTVPIASKFRLGNTRSFPFICHLASRRLCTESKSNVANLCNLSRLKPSTERWLEFHVTVER